MEGRDFRPFGFSCRGTIAFYVLRKVLVPTSETSHAPPLIISSESETCVQFGITPDFLVTTTGKIMQKGKKLSNEDE